MLLACAILGVIAFLTTQMSHTAGRFEWRVGLPQPWLFVYADSNQGQGYQVRPLSQAWLVLAFVYAAFYWYALIRSAEGYPRTLRQGSRVMVAPIATCLIAGLMALAAGSREKKNAFRTSVQEAIPAAPMQPAQPQPDREGEAPAEP